MKPAAPKARACPVVKDFTLGRDSIERARARTDDLAINEGEETVRGTVYLLPEYKKFEIHPLAGGESIRGSIAPMALRGIVDERNDVRPGIVGAVHEMKVRYREARIRGKEPRKTYTLVEIIEEPDLGDLE